MSDASTQREEIVEELRGHADLLDSGSIPPTEAADETRRLAREVERDAPDWKPTATDGSGAAAHARRWSAAGVNLTEKAMGNLFIVFAMLQWVAAGAEGVSGHGLLLLVGGTVALAIGNRLKGWSA